MTYIFPYQIQQINQYHERMLPIRKVDPSPIYPINKAKNPPYRKNEPYASKPIIESSLLNTLFAELTGTGKRINQKI